MNTVVWLVQGILAGIFLVAGLVKLIFRKEQLVDRMPFVEDFSQGVIWLIGVVEVLGAIGIILPAATGVLPFLTPAAAVGLGMNQLGAAWTHLRRREYRMIVLNALILAMAIFVAYGRFVSVPL